MIKELLGLEIKDIVLRLYPSWSGEVVVEEPRGGGFGDYATTVAMSLAKEAKTSPRSVAETVVGELMQVDKLKNLVDDISIDGPGFINFRLTSNCLWSEVNEYLSGQGILDKPARHETVMVEFSSPNIAKPFNVGHLRSTIIGDSLSRMFGYLGYQVLKDNHLGDWGTQYGKLAYAVDAWGDWSKIEADPIPELFQLYVRFHREEVDDSDLADKGRQYFKRLEDKDPEVTASWKKLVDLSLLDFGQLYDQLGVTFDMQLGESFYEPMLKDIIDECKERGIARESQGAWLIFFDDDPELKEAPLMIEKSNGTSTYGTRDLAGIKYRFNEFGLDRLVIEIGNEQRLYFRQIIAAAEMLGWVRPGQLLHIGHGLFILPTGKMSTRRGETVWVRELIEELEKRATQIVAEKSPELTSEEQVGVAKMVTLGALKYNDLSQNRLSNVVFDKEKSLSLDGNSAPYLQYCVARGRKVLKLADLSERDISHVEELLDEATLEQAVLTEHERGLLFHLGKFDESVQQAVAGYLPNLLANYLFQLGQKYSAFYQNDPILQAEPSVRARRLLLDILSVRVMVKGLDLLGIESPERM